VTFMQLIYAHPWVTGILLVILLDGLCDIVRAACRKRD
jgi:hypothetical protein